jgi:hypothetical protein
LKLTAHSRRFIGSFLAALKPVMAMGDAVQLLAFTDHASGKTVSGPDAKKGVLEAAGAQWSTETPCTDGLLLTGDVESDKLGAYVSAAIDMVAGASSAMKQAA